MRHTIRTETRKDRSYIIIALTANTPCTKPEIYAAAIHAINHFSSLARAGVYSRREWQKRCSEFNASTEKVMADFAFRLGISITAIRKAYQEQHPDQYIAATFTLPSL